MSKSKIFLYFCLAFISGIFINSIVFVPRLALLGILILGILPVSIFWRRKTSAVIGFCLLFLALGIWRHQISELRITNYELGEYNDPAQEITLTGTVIREPDIREKSIKLTIAVEQCAENRSRRIGSVLVTVPRYSGYDYGDKLKITGKLETPKELEDFNYKDYLAKDGIYSVIYWPRLELLEKNNYQGMSSVVYAKVLQFKNKLRKSIYRSLSPPHSSILGAMILGDKSGLSSGLKEKLNAAGVRHITAVSGMHVAILTAVLMNVFIGFGLWRKHAFYLTTTLMILFVIMTGLSSSAVRAGLMGGLVLLAQYLGRRNTSARAIVFAAVIMLLHNPLLLRLDVGFQLSFLAMSGIIYLSPALKNWLRFIPDFFNLREILIMSLAAYVSTLPILLYNFGQFSLVSLPANIFVVPSLYWIMLSGFIFASAGLLWQPLGWVLSWPAWLLLTYLVRVADWFGQIPWAEQTIKISWLWLIIFYLILAPSAWLLHRKFTKPVFLG